MNLLQRLRETENSQTHCSSTKNQREPPKLSAIRIQNYEDLG